MTIASVTRVSTSSWIEFSIVLVSSDLKGETNLAFINNLICTRASMGTRIKALIFPFMATEQLLWSNATPSLL